MKIAIVGYGIIGKATHLGLLNNDPNVIINDINIIDHVSTPVESCDLVFVCIPTGDDNEMTVMANVCRQLSLDNPHAEIVVRSTIPPSYINLINDSCRHQLVYCPEFLRERKWQSDCLIKPVLIASDKPILQFFNIVTASECQRVSLKEAAVIKLMNNVFNSMRITFANHVYEYCKSNDADFAKVIPFLKEHQKNGEQSYLEASETLRGFGGKCLPKDLKFCIEDFSKQKIKQTLFTAIEYDNANWPTTIRADL